VSEASSPPWRKLAVLAGVVVVLLGIVYFSPLRGYLGRLRELSDSIRNLGWLAPVVLTLGVAVLVGLGFPRLVLCVLAGMALGFWSGLLWAQVGTFIGNYVLFLGARFFLHDWAVRFLAHRGRRLHDLVRQEGVAGVILARQLPVPGLLINLACGLLPLRQRQYVIGTLIGQLPEAIPCTLIGAGALGGSFKKSAGLIGLGVAVSILAWFTLRWFVNRRRAGAAGEAQELERKRQLDPDPKG